MATLRVIHGQATFNVHMDNGDLGRLMDDVTSRIEAGEGFWV